MGEIKKYCSFVYNTLILHSWRKHLIFRRAKILMIDLKTTVPSPGRTSIYLSQTCSASAILSAFNRYMGSWSVGTGRRQGTNPSINYAWNPKPLQLIDFSNWPSLIMQYFTINQSQIQNEPNDQTPHQSNLSVGWTIQSISLHNQSI